MSQCFRLILVAIAAYRLPSHSQLQLLDDSLGRIVSGWLVGEDDQAAGGRFAVQKLQPRGWATLSEQPFAAAENDRMHPKLVLIHEVVLQERLGELGTADDEDTLARLLLELGDRPGDNRS